MGVELVVEVWMGPPDRLMTLCHEFHNIAGAADHGLNDGKLVAAEPGDEIVLSDTVFDPLGHSLQQFVADMMSERIVDALELVDVDIKQGELLVPAGSLERALDLLAEQHPVRQVGQRVVMRQMRDLFVGAPALGDILHDIDYKSGLAGLIRNSDPPLGDKALAEP